MGIRSRFSWDRREEEDRLQIAIEDINVGDRARQAFERLDELADSILHHGQIQPIVVETTEEGKYRLLAGERRLRACKILKWTHVEAMTRDALSETQRLEIELEENLHRQDFTWQEEVALKRAIDECKRREHGETGIARSSGKWTIVDTAALLGESKTNVAADIALAKAMTLYPELAEEKTKSAAYKRLKLLEEVRLRKLLAARKAGNGDGEALEEQVLHGDLREVLPTLPEGSVDLVIVDPPYGVAFDTVAHDGSAGYQNFNDSPEYAQALLEEMIPLLHRVMARDSAIYIFYSIQQHDRITKLLSETFDNIDPMPIIWHKTNLGGGSVANPRIHRNRVYEVLYYARKGHRDLLKMGLGNVLPYDVVTHSLKLHPTEKPVELISSLIEASSRAGETVLDCCAGAGSTGVAARALKRRFILVERQEHYVNVINQRLSAKPIDPTAPPKQKFRQEVEALLARVNAL